MNVLIVLCIVALTLGVLKFLLSRRCVHTWHTIEEVSTGKCNTYVQRCTKCGSLRVQKLKVR
jgi:hypothetical protein